MIYTADLVIPPNTYPVLPVSTYLYVSYGVVTQVWIRWRWGAGNLAGVRISREGSAVWPYNPDAWLSSLSLETTWNEEYLLAGEPFYFLIEGYNLDDSYQHTVTVVLNVQRPSLSSNLTRFLEYMASGS